MKKSKSAALALALASTIFMAHAEPYKGSIEQVIEEMGDFSADNKTFQVLSKKPLHIRLSPRVVAGQTPEAVKEELLRAATYGVYRTFIHTSVDAVQVTAQPMQVTMGPQGHKLDLLPSPKATVTVTRAKALDVAKQTLQVKSFTDLVDADDTWSPKMENGRYMTRKPGLNKLAADLGITYSR